MVLKTFHRLHPSSPAKHSCLWAGFSGTQSVAPWSNTLHCAHQPQRGIQCCPTMENFPGSERGDPGLWTPSWGSSSQGCSKDNIYSLSLCFFIISPLSIHIIHSNMHSLPTASSSPTHWHHPAGGCTACRQGSTSCPPTLCIETRCLGKHLGCKKEAEEKPQLLWDLLCIPKAAKQHVKEGEKKWR